MTLDGAEFPYMGPEALLLEERALQYSRAMRAQQTSLIDPGPNKCLKQQFSILAMYIINPVSS